MDTVEFGQKLSISCHEMLLAIFRKPTGGNFSLSVIESLKIAEIRIKSKDNQGIFQSILNSMIFGLAVIPFGMLFSMVVCHLFDQFNWNAILLLGTFFNMFLFICAVSQGGLHSAIAHSALCITLWLFGYGPWNYSKFLRYCTDRGFLQRVGGGYRFVHALLRDHFAAAYGAGRGDRT